MREPHATILEPTPEERRLLDAIGERERELCALAAGWARIPSGSGDRPGLDRMRAALASSFSELGGELEEVPLPAGEVVEPDGTVRTVEYAPALRVRRRPQAAIQLALTGHYDTVFPPDSPFRDVDEGDPVVLRGPGVADMKGGLVVLWEALGTLERSPHADALGWEVLLSPDEEIGSPGSRLALAALGARAHAGLTFEPALVDGALVGARRGAARFALVVHGRTAHAGRDPHLGRNAIVAAARFAAAIDTLGDHRPGVTVNVAKIEGGGPTNVVPDLAVCRFEVRAGAAADLDWAAAEIAREAAVVGGRDGLDVTLHGGITRPPKPLSSANRALLELVRAAGAALDLEVTWRDSGGVCEGNNLWAAGCPNVDTLGVRGGGLHSDQEFALRSSFVERARLSALLLMTMARGAFDPRRLRGALP